MRLWYERGEDQMAGERRLDGEPCGLPVPDLTHHDDVFMAEKRAKRAEDAVSPVVPDLTLGDAGDARSAELTRVREGNIFSPNQ